MHHLLILPRTLLLTTLLFLNFSTTQAIPALSPQTAQLLIPPDFDGLSSDQEPSERDIMSLGQMGGNLHPNRSAPAGLPEPLAMSPVSGKSDNRLFAEAMDQWNLHHYKTAYTLFDEYQAQFPQGKWLGEAILH